MSEEEIAMRMIVLRDADPARPLTRQWAALTPSTPFSGWEVFQGWAAGRPPGSEPFVLMAVDAQGKLVAIAPYCLERDRFGIRRLTGMGGQDAWYHDPWVLDPKHADRVAVLLVETLRKHRRDWDTSELILRPHVSGALLAELERLGKVYPEIVDWRQHQGITWTDDWEAYWQTRPAKLRETVARKAKRLAKIPHRFFRAEDHEAEGLWERLFEIQASRFASERDWGPYHDYLRLLCRSERRLGGLYLFGLEIEGQVAALELCLRRGEQVFKLTRTFDDAFTYYSPGSVLAAWVLETLHASGVRQVDPGPGHNAWKAMLQNAELGTVLLRVASPGSMRGVTRLGVTEVMIPGLKKNRLVRSSYRFACALMSGLPLT